MNITVLIENHKAADCSLTAEHGLSLFVEFDGKYYLLDAGSTDAFLKNAQALGVDLHKTDVCLLSHGHYDHSGGFPAFYQMAEASIQEDSPELTRKKLPKLYAAQSVAGEYYSGAGQGIHYIGLPQELTALLAEHHVPITKPVEIAENLWAVPHKTEGLDKIGAAKKLYIKCGDTYEPDDFSHEVSFCFRTNAGLVVVNSCSHGGILNILDEVADIFPKDRVYAFLGGLHMKGTKDGEEICTFPEEEIMVLCQELKRRGVSRIYTGHCTGNPGYDLLKKYLGDQIVPLHTGMRIEIG